MLSLFRGDFLAVPYGLREAPNGRAPLVSRPLRQKMTVSGYGPFFLLLLDSRDCACLIFFLLQPSDLDGSQERLRDVFYQGEILTLLLQTSDSV